MTKQPIDYVRYPDVSMLWQQLDAQCKSEDDCHVLTIPHNINWADGGPTFAVESEDVTLRTLRAKFERLAEMHQEKGNSECMPEDQTPMPLIAALNASLRTRPKHDSAVHPNYQLKRPRQTRSSYYRTLLAEGCKPTNAAPTGKTADARRNCLYRQPLWHGGPGRRKGYRGSIRPCSLQMNKC